jgi:N-acetylglucosamine-6-phosphate deacetylase
MRLKSLITACALVLACSALKASDTLKLEGLLYLDGTAVRISIVEGTITAIERMEESAETKLPFIAPGLIDLQINGYSGVDFSDQNLSTEDFIKATRALWKEGITSYLPTVITADGEMLRNSFTLLASASKDPEIAASIPGFHLEGPYISPEKGFRGAHLEKYIRKPNWEEFAGLQELSGSKIRLVTVAPEMEGAIPFIRNCALSGVLVSLGHHDGSSEQIRQAADAGASLSTHLGNGCANLIDRHNNPLWPQLAEDRLSTTLIADGFHLNQDELKCFYRMKGLERTILVSDALDLAGLPPGIYIRGEREVLLTSDVIKFPAENVLAGAATPLSTCVSNMMDFTGCSLAEAIRMASTNPAKLLGLDKLGEISPGKRADLILFHMSDEGMEIRTTIVKGKIVYAE